MFSRVLMPGVEMTLVEERHALEIYSVVDANRKYLRRWLPWVDLTTGPEITKDWIRKCLKQFAQNKGLHAGIWSNGSFVGTVGCQDIVWLNRRVEIGYWRFWRSRERRRFCGCSSRHPAMCRGGRW